MPYKDPRRHRERQKRYYQSNKDRYLEWARKERIRKQEFVRSLKTKCIRCGFDDPRALDFHHRDPDSKVAAVGKAASHKWRRERILEEIGKCDCLCSNCHRILTSTRRAGGGV